MPSSDYSLGTHRHFRQDPTFPPSSCLSLSLLFSPSLCRPRKNGGGRGVAAARTDAGGKRSRVPFARARADFLANAHATHCHTLFTAHGPLPQVAAAAAAVCESLKIRPGTAGNRFLHTRCRL